MKKRFAALVLAALLALGLAVCAWISVPVPAPFVQFTMQTFAIFAALLALGLTVPALAAGNTPEIDITWLSTDSRPMAYNRDLNWITSTAWCSPSPRAWPW